MAEVKSVAFCSVWRALSAAFPILTKHSLDWLENSIYLHRFRKLGLSSKGFIQSSIEQHATGVSRFYSINSKLLVIWSHRLEFRKPRWWDCIYLVLFVGLFVCLFFILLSCYALFFIVKRCWWLLWSYLGLRLASNLQLALVGPSSLLPHECCNSTHLNVGWSCAWRALGLSFSLLLAHTSQPNSWDFSSPVHLLYSSVWMFA